MRNTTCTGKNHSEKEKHSTTKHSAALAENSCSFHTAKRISFSSSGDALEGSLEGGCVVGGCCLPNVAIFSHHFGILMLKCICPGKNGNNTICVTEFPNFYADCEDVKKLHI